MSTNNTLAPFTRLVAYVGKPGRIYHVLPVPEALNPHPLALPDERRR